MAAELQVHLSLQVSRYVGIEGLSLALQKETTMCLTDSYTTELRGDRWITRSRSAVEIAGTEQVDGRWEPRGG